MIRKGVLHALEFVFQERGYRTVTARSGSAAMGIASIERLDAALIDLHMTGMDGVTLCASPRAASQTIPVWIMTAASSREAETKAREAGAIAVLRKPFDVDEFIRALEIQWGAISIVDAGPNSSAAGSAHAP